MAPHPQARQVVSAPPTAGGMHVTAAGCSSRVAVAGISVGRTPLPAGSRAPLGDTPRRSPASAGDTLGAAAAGTPPGYRSLVGNDKAKT